MDEIVALLRSYRLPFGQEIHLQNTVEEILREHERSYSREHELCPGDRIDFLVGSIGIECKVDGSRFGVLSQLLRYATSGEITGLILLTTRSTHRFAQPDLLGKPFYTLRITGL